MTSTVTSAPVAKVQPASPPAPEPPVGSPPPSAAPVPKNERDTHRSSLLSLSHALWAAALLTVVAGICWLIWPRAKPVEIAIIDRGPVRYDLVDEGRTRIHDVFIVSAPVSGAVQRIVAEPGDSIVAGQTVAQIRPALPGLLDTRLRAETEAGTRAAAANVAAAEADLALAQRNQQRTQALFDKGFVSTAALDTANSAAASRTAALAARQAELRQAQAASTTPTGADGRPVAVRSPVSGRVLQLRQQSESVLSAGTPLLDVGDPARLEIVAEFLSQDAVQMTVGARAYIEDWGGSPIAAHLTRIEPYAHTKVSALGVEEQRVNIIAVPDDPQAAPVLGHGYRVDLRVVVGDIRDTVRVPVDALLRDGQTWSVFVVRHNRVDRIAVAVQPNGDNYRAVRSGLGPGDQVVLFPSDTLRPGDKVKVD